MLRYVIVYNNIVAALGLRAAPETFFYPKNESLFIVRLFGKKSLVLLRAVDYGVWDHSVTTW